MRPIGAVGKSVRDLLGKKYAIDYYQREYRWEGKQVRELINDLTEKFLEEYEDGLSREAVEGFPRYFLGSIIVSQRGESFIVDGQQRLTTLTLLLIALRNLQQGRNDAVYIDHLIFSEQFGTKKFFLDVPEREDCMRALFNGEPYDTSDKDESVVNLYNRYGDIEENFPDELRTDALPYFIDWLTNNVDLVEITANDDAEAYTIFETMNDRGLSLNPTEMLKGYLLANMVQGRRDEANALWRRRVQALSERGDENGSDFFKAWLRSQYANTIRERRKGAVAQDFERIGTEFHRWVGDEKERLGLSQAPAFFDFVKSDFDFYSRQYLRIRAAQQEPVQRLEHIYYNAGQGFTLQDMLLLAPLRPQDDEDTIVLKLRLVARFVDILLTWRIWNFRSIAYSTMQYAMSVVTRDIRGLEPRQLGETLYDRLHREDETFMTNERLSVHQQNRSALHRLLARMTDYIETQSGQASRYREYVATGDKRYEVEHIWANRHEYHADEFDHPADFSEYRNRVGGLLLLPKSFNASYGDLPYEEKLPHYYSRNLLARSLHELAYSNNPGFLGFAERSNLPFRPHPEFKRKDMEERGKLYQQLASQIWNPQNLLREVGVES